MKTLLRYLTDLVSRIHHPRLGSEEFEYRSLNRLVAKYRHGHIVG